MAHLPQLKMNRPQSVSNPTRQAAQGTLLDKGNALSNCFSLRRGLPFPRCKRHTKGRPVYDERQGNNLVSLNRDNDQAIVDILGLMSGSQ